MQDGLVTRNVEFNADGTRMFVVSNDAGDDINEYTLSTAFDVSSETYKLVIFLVIWLKRQIFSYGF